VFPAGCFTPDVIEAKGRVGVETPVSSHAKSVSEYH
jgi:hypothetical protein